MLCPRAVCLALHYFHYISMIYRILKDTGVVCKPFANDVKLYCFPPTPNYSLLSTRWLSGVTSGNSNSHQRNVSFLYSERKLPRPTEEWTTSFFNPEFYLLHGHRPSSSLKTSVCLTTFLTDPLLQLLHLAVDGVRLRSKVMATGQATQKLVYIHEAATMHFETTHYLNRGGVCS